MFKIDEGPKLGPPPQPIMIMPPRRFGEAGDDPVGPIAPRRID